MRRWGYLPLYKKMWFPVAVIVLLCVLIWVFRGYSPLTDEGYLRRAERAHLLPKGDILTEIETGANGPNFLAADGGEYLELCRLPQNSYYATRSEGFYLYEKQGELTVVSLPSRFYGAIPNEGQGGGSVPCALLLFDERAEVQRVELSFVLDGVTYISQAEREVGGVFLCHYFRGERVFYDDVIWDYMPDILDCSAKLYDKNDVLIEETDVPVANLIV